MKGLRSSPQSGLSPAFPWNDSVKDPLSNSAADGAPWTDALDGVVAETAAGRLLPGVHRCLLRVQTPHRPEGWTAAATTHPDDRAGLDAEMAFRIASVTKMMTATALLVLADQGHCRLDDPTGRYLPSDLVDRFHDSTGRPYAAAVTLRQLLDHTSGLPTFFSQPPILEAVRHGAGRRRFTPADLVDLGGGRRAADLAARHGPRLHRHRLPARRAHHRGPDGPAAAGGLPGAGAGPGRHGRHLAGEQR